MRLAFELLDNRQIGFFRQCEHLLVFISFQELQHLLQENYVVQVESRAILGDNILENTGKLGKNRIIFFTEQFMCCIIDLQDNLWPQFQVLRDELLKEVNRIIRVLLVQEVPAFVFELNVDVPQYTQQQFLVKRKVILFNSEIIDPGEVRDLVEQYFSS